MIFWVGDDSVKAADLELTESKKVLFSILINDYNSLVFARCFHAWSEFVRAARFAVPHDCEKRLVILLQAPQRTLKPFFKPDAPSIISIPCYGVQRSLQVGALTATGQYCESTNQETLPHNNEYIEYFKKMVIFPKNSSEYLMCGSSPIFALSYL